jgi:hypothetical protein
VALTTITSPIDGVVTTPERQLREMPGQYVKKGDLITEVHDVSSVTGRDQRVREGDRGREGRPEGDASRRAPIPIACSPARSRRSRARPMAPSRTTPRASPSSSAILGTQARDVVVRTRIPNPGFMLKPDMTGKAKISCGHRSLFSLMTRRLAACDPRRVLVVVVMR